MRGRIISWLFIISSHILGLEFLCYLQIMLHKVFVRLYKYVVDSSVHKYLIHPSSCEKSDTHTLNIYYVQGVSSKSIIMNRIIIRRNAGAKKRIGLEGHNTLATTSPYYFVCEQTSTPSYHTLICSYLQIWYHTLASFFTMYYIRYNELYVFIYKVQLKMHFRLKWTNDLL